MTNKIQVCRIIFYSLAALHVSNDIFTHHQEHLNCIYSFWYYTRWNSVPTLPWYQPTAIYVCNTGSCKYSLDAPDDEQKYRSKHVEQPRNKKLSYTVASFFIISVNICFLIFNLSRRGTRIMILDLRTWNYDCIF